MGNNNVKELRKKNPYKRYGGYANIKSTVARSSSAVQPAPASNPNKLNDVDMEFLISQTGTTKDHINALFQRFNFNNPDGKLDRGEFIQIYSDLRFESPERLDEISSFVFRAFDSDNSGYLSFNEFLV